VTVIESGPQIAGREDPDVAAAIMEMLADEGITVQLGAQVLEVQGRSGTGVKIRFRTAAGEGTIEGSDLLVAVGRTPNTSGIGLDVAGVRLDERGYVAVNDRLETSAADVWAVVSALAARSSPMSRWTISASSGTIWPAAVAAPAVGSCRIACSPTRRSVASA
jgi:NADPH-dependent 2,4-dienoyl-CoA reductase/sulfur reductase-like enzyme